MTHFIFALYFPADKVRGATLPSPGPALFVATLKSKGDKTREVPTALHLIEPSTFTTQEHIHAHPLNALLLIKLAIRMSERIISLSRHMTAALAALLLFLQPGCGDTRNAAAPLLDSPLSQPRAT